MMAIKTVAAGALGEGLEIYDFLVFSFFAVYISRAFFPQQGATQSLLLTVATLGLGFVTRPLGAFYLGMYADRFGRKRVLTLTMWLMGGATAAIALLPAYDQIGVTAQICLVAARLVQGFASGEQVGLAGRHFFALATAMSLPMFLRLHGRTTVGVRSSSNWPGARVGLGGRAEATRSSELCYRELEAYE
jgi:MFS family permease